LQGDAMLRIPLRAVAPGVWPLADAAAAYYVDSAGGVGAVSIPMPRVQVVPPPPTGPCAPNGSRTVSPSEVRVGETFRVTSRLDVTCAPSEAELDVMFAIDHSFSMGTLGRLDNAVRAVDEFLGSVDDADVFTGLVAFNERVTHRVQLAEDPTALRAVLNGLRPDGGTDIGNAMNAALGELDGGRPTARKVMVVVTDGANSSSATPILDAAGRAHEAGVLVITVCAGGECDPDLALAATASEYAFSVQDAAALVDIFNRLAGVLTQVNPAAFELQETIPPDFGLRGGSPAPVIAPWDPRIWLWGFAAPGEAGVEVTHDLVTTQPGRRPVSLRSVVRYTLDGGATGEFHLPAAEVDVQTDEVPALPTAAPLQTPDPDARIRRVFLPAGSVP
jgi:hypothetical protein